MRRIKPIPGNLPLFPTPSSWTPPVLSELPSWKDAKRVAIDSEFKDVTLRTLGLGSRRGAKIAGYSFMLEGHRPFYVPLRHPGQNVDCEQGLNYLRDNLRSFKGELLGANANVELDMFHYEGIEPIWDNVVIQDVQVRDPLINELHFKYSLESIAERRGIQGKNKELLKKVAQENGYDVEKSGWEGAIPSLEAKYVGIYGEADVACLFPIYHSQHKDIERLDLYEAVAMQAQLLPVLVKMRQRGVRVDFDELDRVEKWALEEETQAIAEIKHLTGWDIGINNIMAAARVAPALEAIGIKVPLTETGIPSIKTEYLATIDHKVAKLIRYARQTNKLRTTFVSSVRRYQTNGRIHTTFRQIVGASEKNEKTGAAYGRLSSVHPNLQQQPSKGDIAKRWRRIYLPEPGMLWCSSDFSAQEPRWAVKISAALNLPGAAEMLKRYQDDPRMDQHSATAELTGVERSYAKIILLAVLYGEGDSKLCHTQLKLPTRWMVQDSDGIKRYFEERKQALDYRHQLNGRCRLKEVAGEEAQAIMDKFHAGVPFFRELSRRVIKKVEETGFLRLLGGRRINFPMAKDGSWENTYKALNRLCQGNAAAQTQLALIAIEKELPGLLQIQLHDEVLFSSPDMKTAKRVGEIMTSVVPGKMPWRSDLEVGPDWGNLTQVCLVKDCLDFIDPRDKMACSTHSVIR